MHAETIKKYLRTSARSFTPIPVRRCPHLTRPPPLSADVLYEQSLKRKKGDIKDQLYCSVLDI